MTRSQTIFLAIGLSIMAAAGWVAFAFVRTVHHLPEAYAAWDSGELLVEYMKQHNNHWPSSWDDLLTVLNSDAGRSLMFHGGEVDRIAYARSLQQQVSIDWNFQPADPYHQNPVRPRVGEKFSVTWENAEPNGMIRTYLSEHPATRPSKG